MNLKDVTFFVSSGCVLALFYLEDMPSGSILRAMVLVTLVVLLVVNCIAWFRRIKTSRREGRATRERLLAEIEAYSSEASKSAEDRKSQDI